MLTWKKMSDLMVTNVLRLGKNANMKITNSDGSESTIDLQELAQLDTASRTHTLGAAKTMTANDAKGDIYFLALAGGFTVTLPAPAAGLSCKFIVSVAPTTAYIIVTSGGANIMKGGINELEVDTGDDGPYDDNADTLNFVASTAVIGDWVEFVSDGTSWFFTGQTNADGGITTSTT